MGWMWEPRGAGTRHPPILPAEWKSNGRLHLQTQPCIIPQPNLKSRGTLYIRHILSQESSPTDPSLPPSLHLHHPLPTLLPLGRSDDTAGEHKSFPAQVTFGMFNLREVQMCSSNSVVYGHQDFHGRFL